MSDNTREHIEKLEKLRALLVKERRRIASMASEVDVNSVGIGLKAVQEKIEAVDRAMKDEEEMIPSAWDGNLTVI